MTNVWWSPSAYMAEQGLGQSLGPQANKAISSGDGFKIYSPITSPTWPLLITWQPSQGSNIDHPTKSSASQNILGSLCCNQCAIML